MSKKKQQGPAITTAPTLPIMRRIHTEAVDRPTSTRAYTPTQCMTIEGWMARLYTLATKESELTGDLGVWPVELREYLVNLCRCYTPTDAEPARLTFREGMLARYDEGSVPLLALKPAPAADGRPVCALLLSGGKDSIAAGLEAERVGYAIHAFYGAKFNHSYSFEADAVPLIAEALGWPLTILEPKHLPRSLGNNVVKNQYLISLALDTLARDGLRPAAVACGNFLVDDCYTTPWYGDMQVAFSAFAKVIEAAYAAAYVIEPPLSLTLLDDVLQALRVWDARCPDAAKAVTASCMMPARNRVQHRRRALEQGVPLISVYDCGVCEKCKLRAVLLSDRIGTELPYPPEYLAKARRWLRGAFKSATWCHTHPALAVRSEDLVDAMTRALGDKKSVTRMYLSGEVDWSQAYQTQIVYNGGLGVTPKRHENPAVEPVCVEWREHPPVAAPQLTESTFGSSLRDRIIGFERVRASELAPNPDNWREHPPEQRAMLREMWDAVGFVGVELARRLPDGRLSLIDGHARQEMAVDEYDDPIIPVAITDLDDDETALVLASYDPIAQLATANTRRTQALAARISDQHHETARLLLNIAKYEDEIHALLNRTDDVTLPAPTLNEPEGGEVEERLGVLAECATEAEQRRVYELLTAEGITCRVLTL